MKELLSTPFLLKMFVEVLPLTQEYLKISTLDIYEKFEDISFDRELRKQTTYVNEMKYSIKDVKEYQ